MLPRKWEYAPGLGRGFRVNFGGCGGGVSRDGMLQGVRTRLLRNSNQLRIYPFVCYMLYSIFRIKRTDNKHEEHSLKCYGVVLGPIYPKIRGAYSGRYYQTQDSPGFCRLLANHV